MSHERNLKLRNVYLAHIGRREGQGVWIVDGALVARDIYPEFIFGGNDMRYCFNPPGDVWIDNRIGVEELVTTLKHELVERRLMMDNGLTYNDAHNEALKLELTLRPNWEKRCVNEGLKLIQYSEKFLVKPLLAVPQEKLARLYRQPYGRYRGASIWIVDGTIVRQHLDQDYGSVDSLYMQSFVPPNQFWIDSSVCSLEAYFALFRRKALHRLSLTGLHIDKCTEQALAQEVDERKRQCSYAARHELLLDPVSYGARDRGPMHQ